MSSSPPARGRLIRVVRPRTKSVMKARSVEEQFEPEQVKKIRDLQSRVDSLRTSHDASAYFMSEASRCLDAGLLLASLQVLTSGLELRVRELLIARELRKRSNLSGDAFSVEQCFEEQRFTFRTMLDKLPQDGALTANECGDLMKVYGEIRIPVHHGIVGRYLQSLGENKDHGIADILWGNTKAHITTGESDLEDAVDKHGITELERVVSLIEAFSNKFPTDKLSLSPIVP